VSSLVPLKFSLPRFDIELFPSTMDAIHGTIAVFRSLFFNDVEFLLRGELMIQQWLRCPVGLAIAIYLFSSSVAWADPVFFTSESAWRTVASDEEDLDFTGANVATANEVPSPPSNNDQLGGVLTFEAGNTGLSSSFTLTTLESDAGFTFNDNEGSGPEWDDALSVGDIDNFEDDDWQITFDSNSVYNFAWFLQDNGVATGESFSVYDKASDSLLGTFSGIPSTDGIDFVGVTSTTPIGRVLFDEGSGGDDIAMGGIVLSSTVVPEPSSAMLCALTLLGAGGCCFRGRWK